MGLFSMCFGKGDGKSTNRKRPPKRKKEKRKKVPKGDTSKCIKLRVGWNAKDIFIDGEDLNVRAIFGQFAVLIDYSSKEIIPLTSDGFPTATLKPRARYVVEVNTHGTMSPQMVGAVKKPKFPFTSSPKSSRRNSPNNMQEMVEKLSPAIQVDELSKTLLPEATSIN